MVLTRQRITRALTPDEEGRESMKANRGLKAAMLAMAMVVLATTAVSAAPTDEQKCQSGRAKEAGKFSDVCAELARDAAQERRLLTPVWILPKEADEVPDQVRRCLDQAAES